MENYYLKDWKAWKEICEFYNFDPHKGGTLKVNERGGNISNFSYTGDIPKKDKHVT